MHESFSLYTPQNESEALGTALILRDGMWPFMHSQRLFEYPTGTNTTCRFTQGVNNFYGVTFTVSLTEWLLEWCCAGPRDWPRDACGSPPNRHILWFCELLVTYIMKKSTGSHLINLPFLFWLLCTCVNSTHLLEEKQNAQIQEGNLMHGDGATTFAFLFPFNFWRTALYPAAYQTDTSRCVTAWCEVASPIRYLRVRFYLSVLTAATHSQHRLLLLSLFSLLG